jgi:2Fe-2S ferredoxin
VPRITFKPLDRTVEVSAGTSILEAAIRHGVDLEHACGGHAACATCHVYVHTAGLPEIEELEEDQLQEAVNRKPNSRLGCQLRPTTDVVVEIPCASP